MCVYTCTCVWNLWGDDVEATGWLQTLFLRHCPSCLVGQDPLLAWSSPVRQGQLAWAPRLFLRLPSQCRDHKTAPWHPAFVHGFYGSNPAPHNAGTASTLPIKLSPQSQETPFISIHYNQTHDRILRKTSPHATVRTISSSGHCWYCFNDIMICT